MSITMATTLKSTQIDVSGLISLTAGNLISLNANGLYCSTASKLVTARTINGVAFDGTANITIPTVDGTKLPLTGGTLTGSLTVQGDVYATGNVTAYSDIRLKTNIQIIPNALDKVKALRGVTFDRVDCNLRQAGLLAQELQAVLPEAVDDSGEYLGVAYGNVTGLLVEAIKELASIVEQLKADIK